MIRTAKYSVSAPLPPPGAQDRSVGKESASHAGSFFVTAHDSRYQKVSMVA